MKEENKNYPTFDFTVEGFEQLRAFANEINNFEKKIEFYNYQIQKYDEQHSEYIEPVGINFRSLLIYERDYWDYIIKLAENTKTPKHENGDSISDDIWIEEVLNSCVLKPYFQKWELFDFDLMRIKEHAKEIESINNQIIYLRFVYKEFKIKTLLYPEEYTTPTVINFTKKILNRIKTIESKIKEKRKISKKRPQHRPTSKTDIEKLLYFASMLEKLRAGKTHYNYNGILNHVAEKFNIGKYTLPNWLKNRLKYLKEERDIADLTEEDMRFLWHKHREK